VIKKFIQKVFGRTDKAAQSAATPALASTTKRRKDAVKDTPGAPRKYTRTEHGIDRRDISDAAIRTCEGLHAAGYDAFVVGGAVRDLLLGRHPKDFDIATSATPEQVRGVFRRSRIIGRRFRIVHVMFGPETIEVTTFRGAGGVPDEPASEMAAEKNVDRLEADDVDSDSSADEPEDASRSRRRPRDGRDGRRNQPIGPKSQADEHGRLLRDNVFGNQQEDAIRRDFTMNALFYDPEREEVWDYVNGVPDIQKKRVVMIGDPAERYREDPVRMLRASRLAGKLGFTIDPATEAPIATMAPLLENVPSARLFDEMLKLLLSGHSLLCIEKLRALGLHKKLLPVIDSLLENPESRPFVVAALNQTDARIAADKSVSPSFLFAALFWFPMLDRSRELTAKGVRPVQAMHEAMDDVLDEQRKALAIPRRYDPMVKELWVHQPRFLQRSAVKAYRVLSHPRFRACYDFFELRAEAGDAPQDVADWWEKFQIASDAEREAMFLPDDEPKKKRRRKRKKPGDPAAQLESTTTSLPDDALD
jgi:poly(A) polymerase